MKILTDKQFESLVWDAKERGYNNGCTKGYRFGYEEGLKANIMNKQKSSVETNEALERIKEVTEAANECVKAFKKLEKVMGRFTNRGELKDVKVSIVLDRKVFAEAIVKHTADSIQGRVIKRSEINEIN
ncbi:hypothetical protein [Bacillus thuringiensis]|uniref:hypothetical protein n=1 Tax=Bacillus thuringiensis TaxID=1428 RepID=UPI0039B73AEC